MTCTDFRTELNKWLLAALEQAGREVQVPRGLAEHARKCPDCAPRLAAAESVLKGSDERVDPPSDLVARVKSRINRPAGGAGRLGRRVVLRYAAAAAVLVVAVAAGIVIGRGWPGGPGTSLAAGQPEVLRVEFRLEAPAAQSVAVVGDWNAWNSERDVLRDEDGDGVWEATIRLKRGSEYQYQFLIDGEMWVPDPASPMTVDDGFGGTNSVLNI